jgi:hypothetical protein
MLYYIQLVTRWRSSLRYCSTRRKVAGPIPVDLLGIIFIHTVFHVPTVLKRRRLNLLEPSAPVHESTGIVSPFYYKQRDDLNLCIIYVSFDGFLTVHHIKELN